MCVLLRVSSLPFFPFIAFLSFLSFLSYRVFFAGTPYQLSWCLCCKPMIAHLFNCLENIVYHYFRQLWLVLGVKLMEINSNLFSRWVSPTTKALRSQVYEFPATFVPIYGSCNAEKGDQGSLSGAQHVINKML